VCDDPISRPENRRPQHCERERCAPIAWVRRCLTRLTRVQKWRAGSGNNRINLRSENNLRFENNRVVVIINSPCGGRQRRPGRISRATKSRGPGSSLAEAVSPRRSTSLSVAQPRTSSCRRTTTNSLERTTLFGIQTFP